MVMLLTSGLAGAAGNADDLAKATANPVADLISVPLQSNWDTGYGPENKTQYTLNVQPVIPFRLNADWNLISRTIIPVINQPGLAAGQNDVWGIGDIVQSLFFSPRATSGGLIWGAGTVLLLPTANDSRLGLDRWGAGPTGVVLKQANAWTYGALANHLWSFAGDGPQKVNVSYMNPFVTYSLGGGWSNTLQTEVTYNWEARNGQRTTMPISYGVAKVLTLGGQPISVGVTYKHYVETPRGQPDWGLRFVVSFLFPR